MKYQKLSPEAEAPLIARQEDSQLHPRITVSFNAIVIHILEGRHYYAYDLNRIKSASECLDLIFEVASNPWCDLAMVGELVHAIEDVTHQHFDSNAQGVLCPNGANMKIDWEKSTFTSARK